MLNRCAEGWPTTVDEAVGQILAELTGTEKEMVGTTPACDLDWLHFGLGVRIRNDCGLWGGNTDLLASCGLPDMHADAASAVIIRVLWERLRPEG